MKLAGILMIIGSAMLLGLFVFPMWNIRLGAPQYPEPLGIDIHVNGLKGESEFDIQNIDGLNHYIGMKTLPKSDEMWEFSIFPKVVGLMAGLGIIIGILGLMKKIPPVLFLIWFVLMSVLGGLGIYDFNLWLVAYGTDLEPNAILKLINPDGTPMKYNPPLIGHKKLLNFDAYSYPRTGGILMGLGMLLTLVAYFKGEKEVNSSGKKKKKIKSIFLLALACAFVSCEVKAQPINYGKDGCHFCKMAIVDNQHASQIVTVKGKSFKYDAIECMMNDLKEWEHPDVHSFLVADYANPGQLIDATSASYLISPSIPSPMGENLSAFQNRSDRNAVKNTQSGQALTWDQLLEKF